MFLVLFTEEIVWLVNGRYIFTRYVTFIKDLCWYLMIQWLEHSSLPDFKPPLISLL